MMTFPRYDSYKDSGVEWLGEIPSHWDCRRLKHIAKVRLSNVDKHSRANELPVKLCNYTDVYYQSFITNEVNFMEATATEEQIYNFSLEKGDVLITKDSESFDDIAVSAYVPKTLKNVICGYHLAHIKPTHIEGSYLFRAFQAEGISSQFRVSANGITRFGIGKSAINDAVFLLPPIAEQKRIVEFLDRSTAEIDRAIAQKQRLIELLQEQKAILINQAVTKGLNPNVPMRDSAIEWIGEIPEHWKVFPLTKYVKSIVDYRGKTPTKVESGVFLVTAKNIKDGLIDYEISKEYVAKKEYGQIMSRGFPAQNDLLFTTEAPLGGVALIDREDVALAQRIIKFRLKEECLDPEFTRYSMLSSHFQNYLLTEATGSTAQGMKASKLHKLRIAAPPIEEQLEIVNFISLHLAQSSEVIFQQQGIIENLTELRQVLIANAVTGKIKV